MVLKAAIAKAEQAYFLPLSSHYAIMNVPKDPSQAQNDTGLAPALSSPVSQDLDDSYSVYKDSLETVLSASDVKNVLRKLDLRIMPILFVTYMLQYLDKNSINFASVYGLAKGTRLKGQDYSWLGMYIEFNT